MGLDMYLNGKIFVGKYGDAKLKDSELVGISTSTNKEIRLPTNTLTRLEFELGYWRKANAIHNWFVENVQGGVDDCREYDVSFEQLCTLQSICEKILKSYKKSKTAGVKQAKMLFPVKEGFFFGSYDYDEYYFDCLNDTIEIINKVAKYIELFGDVFYFQYQSSW